ncbi:hypothetical protein [Hyalangium gracile]|uniref:hypothetical protein n=1 Tax=Hyalangium gracile TaxID=394092 RepID=UPI001CCC14D9|nr:hypothetical protein [Hyalangium gracile]
MTSLVLSMVLTLASPLEPARAAYQSGELAQARTELEALLYPLRLEGAELEAEAHLLLAATYHAQEDAARAEHEAVLGLAVNPDTKLDPLLYPPDFVAFVERVRAVHRERIATLAAERRPPVLVPAPPPAPKSAPRPALQASARPSKAWYLVPFGVGHFQHGRRTRGTVLAVMQGTSLAVSAASLGTALALRGPDGLYSSEDARLARKLNTSYLVTAYAFGVLYAYGALEGIVFTP